jgi:SAM-dependent methyltransferase
LQSCPLGARILDVGCGNDSPRYFKTARPDLYYVGLDIRDYMQSEGSRPFADEYIIEPAETFNDRIESMAAQFDAVVSSHNIEHCDDPARTMTAMLKAIKQGGRLFMSFPSEASVRFPHRNGCLNFYDDASHHVMPKFHDLTALIGSHGLNVDVSLQRYRPWLKTILGFCNELASRKQNLVLPGTWAYWGFESIIWASRRS